MYSHAESAAKRVSKSPALFRGAHVAATADGDRRRDYDS
jgi:hypothetical protein